MDTNLFYTARLPNRRDADGWRIPREGTRARKIYDLAKEGLDLLEICKRFPKARKDAIQSALHTMKNPESANASSREAQARRRGAPGARPKMQTGGRSKGKGKALAFLHAHKDYSSDECLLWPFYVHPNGFPQVAVAGRATYANRIMCELAHGKPAFKARASNTCNSRACVNPKHLFWKKVHDKSADAAQPIEVAPNAPAPIHYDEPMRHDTWPPGHFFHEWLDDWRRRKRKPPTVGGLVAMYGAAIACGKLLSVDASTGIATVEWDHEISGSGFIWGQLRPRCYYLDLTVANSGYARPERWSAAELATVRGDEPGWLYRKWPRHKKAEAVQHTR